MTTTQTFRYPAGTPVLGTCTAYTVDGVLLDDIDSFDEVFRVRCDDGEIVRVNAGCGTSRWRRCLPMLERACLTIGLAIRFALILGSAWIIGAAPHLLFWR